MDSVPSLCSDNHDRVTLPSPAMSSKEFSDLPAEIRTMIFVWLPIKDKFSAMRVSRAWHLHIKEERKVWELFDVEGLKIPNAETALKAYESAAYLARGGIKHVILVPSSQHPQHGQYLLNLLLENHPPALLPYTSAYRTQNSTPVPAWLNVKQNIESFTYGFSLSGNEWEYRHLLFGMTSLKELHIMRHADPLFLKICIGNPLPQTLRRLRIDSLEYFPSLISNWQLRGRIEEFELHQIRGANIRVNNLVLLAETLKTLTLIDSTIISKPSSSDYDAKWGKLIDWDVEMPLSALTNLRSLTLERCMIHARIDLPLSLLNFDVKDSWHMGKFADKDRTIGKDWSLLKKASGSWVRTGDGGKLGLEDWQVVLLEHH